MYSCIYLTTMYIAMLIRQLNRYHANYNFALSLRNIYIYMSCKNIVYNNMYI